MRTIKFVGLIRRLNCLNKSSNIYSRSAVCSSKNLTEHCNIQTSNFSNAKRQYSNSPSSNHTNQSSGVASTFIGAVLFGTLAYKINENSKKNILLAKEEETPISNRIDDFLEEAKKEVEKVKEVLDEVKEVLDESIEIGDTIEKIGDHLAKKSEEAAEIVEKVIEEIENDIKSVVDEFISNETKSKLAVEVDEKFLPEIPSHVQYLIVGGGTAANSAYKSIRAKDANAKVLVVTEEEYKPYMRPPLSKDLWMTDDQKLVKNLEFKQYNGNKRSIYFLDDEFYVSPKELNQQENGGVAVLTGKRVLKVDSENKTAKLDNSWEISYDKCLIATGGKPKTVEAFKKSPEQFKDKVTLFRNIKDFEKLLEVAKQGKNIAIVGGGFLGSELACALAHSSKKYGGSVTQIFPESGNLQKVLPEYLTKWTTKKLVEEGVTVVPNARITGAQINDNKVELQFVPTLKLTDVKDTPKCSASWIMADHVVVAAGLEVNVELATNSGFEVHPELGGFVVNAELQARDCVWVAGDAACFYDTKLGRRRVEHHDHAVVSGRLAGANMTGQAKPYWHQSMFWSDIGPKIGFEAIGLVDSSLQTVGLFAKADETDTPSFEGRTSEGQEDSSKKGLVKSLSPNNEEFGKGVVLYLKNDVVVGCLMWNVFKKVPIARQLIQSQEKITDFKEMAKLFEINAEGLGDE